MQRIPQRVDEIQIDPPPEFRSAGGVRQGRSKTSDRTPPACDSPRKNAFVGLTTLKQSIHCLFYGKAISAKRGCLPRAENCY